MRTPQHVVERELQRWRSEEVTLNQFLVNMYCLGWTKSETFAWIVRELEEGRP